MKFAVLVLLFAVFYYCQARDIVFRDEPGSDLWEKTVIHKKNGEEFVISSRFIDEDDPDYEPGQTIHIYPDTPEWV
ncbi:hypothetical protein TKK_0019564 [Trichogramma kaykai]